MSDAGDKVGDAVGTIAGIFGGDDAKKKANDAVDGAGKTAGNAVSDTCNKALEELKKSIDNLLVSAARSVGIKEYYSLHIGSLCEGDFTQLNAADAKPNVQSCTPKFEAQDLTERIDEALRIGDVPPEIKSIFNPGIKGIGDLNIADSVLKVFNLIPKALRAMAIFYLCATLGIVAGFLCAIATAVLGRSEKLQIRKFALLAGLGTMGFGWLLSFIGVAGSTIAVEKIKQEVSEHGVGIVAATSPVMFFLLWTSLVCSTIAFTALFMLWWRMRKGNGLAAPAQYVEKNQSVSTMADSHGYFQEEQINGGPQRKEYEDVPM